MLAGDIDGKQAIIFIHCDPSKDQEKFELEELKKESEHWIGGARVFDRGRN